jgi:hypothetical protein
MRRLAPRTCRPTSSTDWLISFTMEHRRKPLHMIQLVAGLAMFPAAWWMYSRADYLGVAFAVIIGLLVVTYTVVNLFVRQWP